MDLLSNIDNVLVEKRLHTIKEAGKRSRLRPAVIVMNRGTVIEADHVRQINHPETGTPMIIFGIKPGYYPRWASRYQRIGSQRASLIGRMRDFTTAGGYVPCEECGQDETGWSEPDEHGKYDAHREYEWNNRFQYIMTAYMSNVRDIKWLHESENQLRDEPNRYDYRGKKGRGWATKDLYEIMAAGVPEVILNRLVAQLVAGINATVAARSKHLGIPQAVRLESLDLVNGEIMATWLSGQKRGVSTIPPGTSAAELAAFLEEESADHWNSP
jgi:hypothetical protein